MAKKKTSEDSSASSAPPRRRAPAKKQATSAPATATANAIATASESASDNGRSEPTQAEIAEAAYFRHLNRGGSEGDEFTDWIEAERELRERVR